MKMEAIDVMEIIEAIGLSYDDEYEDYHACVVAIEEELKARK